MITSCRVSGFGRQRVLWLAAVVLLCLSSNACAASSSVPASSEGPTEEPQSALGEGRILADVVSVVVRGEPGNYSFDVGIKSPDQGCDQFADWWEVVSADGDLLYRRILLHSHVTEQPFVRGGPPIAIDAETVVWVRAHMHPGGYGGVVFRGSGAGGFGASELPSSFAAELAEQAPLPQGCAN